MGEQNLIAGPIRGPRQLFNLPGCDRRMFFFIRMTVEGDTAVVVSKGLGTHTVNLRVFNPAEVVVIHL